MMNKNLRNLIIGSGFFLITLIAASVFSFFNVWKFLPLIFFLLGFCAVIFSACALDGYLKERKGKSVKGENFYITTDPVQVKAQITGPAEIFKKSLEDRLKVTIAGLDLTTENKSRYLGEESGEPIPAMVIYTLGECYYSITERDSSGKVSGQFENPIRKMWKDSLEQCGVTPGNYYDREMWISVMRFEYKCYAEYTSNCKDSVRQYVYRKIHKYPKYVKTTDYQVIIVVEKEDFDTLYTKEVRADIQKWVLEQGKKYVSGKYKSEMSCPLEVGIVAE